MLLSTSEKSGFCYIKTKNIDGETNLKNKQSNHKLKKIIKTEEDISKLKYITELDINNIFDIKEKINLINLIFYFSLFKLSFDFLFLYVEKLSSKNLILKMWKNVIYGFN